MHNPSLVLSFVSTFGTASVIPRQSLAITFSGSESAIVYLSRASVSRLLNSTVRSLKRFVIIFFPLYSFLSQHAKKQINKGCLWKVNSLQNMYESEYKSRHR